MQLNSFTSLSTITAIAIVTSNALYAENYVAVEFLQYDENDNRVSVSAPTLSASYDIGTDFTIKADFVHDAVSGATPSWQVDSVSGASGGRNTSGDYVYENQAFDEERNAGSIMLTTRFSNRDELYTGFDYSRESDFDSKSLSVEYMHYTDKSHNQSINIGVSYAINEILSNRNGEYDDDDDDYDKQYRDRDDDDDYDTDSGASRKEESNSLNIQAGISQILNEHSSVKVEAFALLDNGYLTNPYGNVVREYNTINQRLVTENRPDKRTAYGVSLKYNRLLSDDLAYQANYRFYADDWDINSHTIKNDLYYDLNKVLTFGAGIRYYIQSSADFYNPSKDFFTTQTYASSDARLSAFDAFTYNASVDYKMTDALSYNLGAQFYTQSTGLEATFFTTGIKYRY